MSKRFLSVLLLSAVSAFSSPLLHAEADSFPPMWPNVEYTAQVPTFKDVLGYNVGERITHHSDMIRFFEALKHAAPDRVKLVEYAKSWEGRSLIYVAIGKPEYISNLEQFATDMQALADPRVTNKSQADQLKARLPASVWLQYAVHGNEISGTDAAMQMAYHLLAASQDPVVQTILDNTIVFIDPLQNPDGRTRFTTRYYATVGMEHSSDRVSAEQNEPWPSGRTNHYLFDMNRDWLPISQPETQGRVAALNKFKPLVAVDIHEMGGDMTYYFAPAAEPFNPHMTAQQIANMNAIGRNHGKHFDEFGFDYFTREIFDAFYPGYGDSWPTFYGASASTYEVGSARGHHFMRRTGDVLTYWDTVQQQFIASVSTAEGTALNREQLLNDFYQYQVTAISEGKKNDERVYIIPTQDNREGTHRLVTLMAEHGVEVRKASENFKACGVNYPAGSYFIDTAQPRGRFVTTTFTDQVDMDADFLREQERRRERNLNDQIYDVTGWSLPMMYNVQANACDREVKADNELIGKTEELAGTVNNPDASVGFVVAWGDMAAGRFLTMALREGLQVKSANEAFMLEGNQAFPAGSLIIEKRANGKDIADQVAQIAKATGAIVQGVDSSWVIQGPSFGSPRTMIMTAPKVAIAWDAPTSSLSAGNTRFVIERQLGYPVTAIRTEQLTYADLGNYDVLILPEGNYAGVLGQSGADNLRDWVQQGGILIALGSANRFTTNADYGLLDVNRELAFRDAGEGNADSPQGTVSGQLFDERGDLDNAIVEAHTHLPSVSGALANIEVDQEHWLTAGVDSSLVALAYGRDVYTPIKLDSGKNLAWFKGKDELLASGYLWDDNKAQLAYKPFLIYQPTGNGMVIGYTQSPTIRAYLEGLNVLLTNTIFRSAAAVQ
ncbi:M14 family metallopeptidase [Alteromonas sp. ASW11-36]|uniref:M14 family metallopeptidase n=1 Tax=Alteromonas arenosi TaxID=3055817 RepID=A0ABT7SX23_9ALTE|nr:M14 family metallopeptidase [Alteromonas sp. ASW11-36]MDM7860743.1 M14 family metallopeptidase [Alteromonas sp. ASW11-36]